jgi:vancomycin aglycone glucosyltransferase
VNHPSISALAASVRHEISAGRWSKRRVRSVAARSCFAAGPIWHPWTTNPTACPSARVNQQALFKRVAAVVHHGGAGTTTAAARAGAPQVLIPQLFDQHYWAQRINDLGIGTAHPPVVPTADSLTVALSRALQPDVATRAQSIGGAVRTDGATVAAQRLMAADSQSSS